MAHRQRKYRRTNEAQSSLELDLGLSPSCLIFSNEYEVVQNPRSSSSNTNLRLNEAEAEDSVACEPVLVEQITGGNDSERLESELASYSPDTVNSDFDECEDVYISIEDLEMLQMGDS